MTIIIDRNLLKLILYFIWLVAYSIPNGKSNPLYIMIITGKLKLIGAIVIDTIKETKGI